MNKKNRIPKNNYCKKCGAVCCKNLAMAIGKPKTKKEIADLEWQLHFDTVKVYVHKHHWYQLIEGWCMYLGKDNRCDIYQERPTICRKHSPPNCEMFGAYYDVMFNEPKDLGEYLRKTKRRKK